MGMLVNFKAFKMEVLEACDLVDTSPAPDKDCLVAEDLSSKKKKLILIQAPSDYDIRCLKGEAILLDGVQDLAVDENVEKGKRFAVKSKMNCKKNLKSFSVILPSKEDSKLKLAKPLRGSISIIQSIRVPPVAFPEKEDVILPPVLEEQKHKWTPFGCDYPVSFGKKRRHEASKDNVSKSKHAALLKLKTPIKTERVSPEKQVKSNKRGKSTNELAEIEKGEYVMKKRIKKEVFEDNESVSDDLNFNPSNVKQEILDESQLKTSKAASSPKTKTPKKKKKK